MLRERPLCAAELGSARTALRASAASGGVKEVDREGHEDDAEVGGCSRGSSVGLGVLRCTERSLGQLGLTRLSAAGKGSGTSEGCLLFAGVSERVPNAGAGLYRGADGVEGG